MIKRFFLWLASLIFGPKIVAAEQGAEAAYRAADQKEQAAAVEAKAAEIQLQQQARPLPQPCAPGG